MTPLDAQQCAEMFDQLTKRYRITNHILSCGLDIYWRKKVIQKLTHQLKNTHNSETQKLKNSETQELTILDIACGTGELTKELQKLGPIKLHGVDISNEMLKQARQKNPGINFHQASADSLPFCDQTFDLITISFGIRNFSDKEKALKEIKRVLKTGGTLAILEFSLPDSKILRRLYTFHLKYILPTIGAIFTGQKKSYSYLAESIINFSKSDLNALLSEKFSEIRNYKVFPRVCTITISKKNV